MSKMFIKMASSISKMYHN